MAKIPFNVDAYTAKLIGRENVANLDGAVLELVKNTYDADATICFLYYEEETDTLYLGDNGSGMTRDIIQKHWMTIGSSSKRNNFKTKKGRIQTGAKGIGRFALDRIADKCQLLTISVQEHLIWTVDWSMFEFGRNITEVEAELDSASLTFTDFISDIVNREVYDFIKNKFNKLAPQNSTGSIFKLTGLRDAWNKQTLASIRANLVSLIPCEFREFFNIYLFESTTQLKEATVFQHTDDIAYDYKITFKAHEDGKVEIQIFRDEFDFGNKVAFERVMNDAGFSSDEIKYFKKVPIHFNKNFAEMIKNDKLPDDYSIGSFRGTFYFTKLAAATEDRKKFFYKDITGRKNLTSILGGIRIYRDNFRVRPYGEPESSAADWLMLARRRNKSPAGVASNGKWCVSSDQIHGNIYISRTNLTLPDQANRQGIVDTSEFAKLKLFLEEVIKLFEDDRQAVCRKLDAYYKKLNPTEKLEKDLKKLAKNPETNQVSKVFDRHEVSVLVERKDATIKQLEDELQLLSALATTGIVTNTYIHEMKSASANLGLEITMAKEAVELDKDIVKALSHIKKASRIRSFFTSWFQITVESIQRDKRKLKRVLLKELFPPIIQSWYKVLRSTEIHYSSRLPEDFKFKCFPYEMETILNNLITNSTASFEYNIVENKQISILIDEIENGIKISYSDNGFGLSKAYKECPEKILNAFETSRRDSSGEEIGTGMGMWIVSRIVKAYNGTIDLSKNTEQDSGFFIDITLKTK